MILKVELSSVGEGINFYYCYYYSLYQLLILYHCYLNYNCLSQDTVQTGHACLMTISYLHKTCLHFVCLFLNCCREGGFIGQYLSLCVLFLLYILNWTKYLAN